MIVNFFMPKYMVDFKCISSKCIDTCCAGWDINIDEDTYNHYINSTGELKILLEGKFIENKNDHDKFNKGFMILKSESRCPFLNENMLCDIHGSIGEEHLCITCKSYPRVFNIVDNTYEKSGLPSCEEICRKAFLNKEKMEFIEVEEHIDEKNIEIRRIIDSEAFEGSDSLLQYFWDLRVMTINIMQERDFAIEERLNIIKSLYKIIQGSYEKYDFDKIEEILEDFNNGLINIEDYKGECFKEKHEFYKVICEDALVNNIRSVRLRECIEEYKHGILSFNLDKYNEVNNKLESYSYILENYLVNQIFKNLIPFNKGDNLVQSINELINSYRIIKAYIIGISINLKNEVNENIIIRVIQSLSKDMEHNKVFKKLLDS